VGRPRGFRDREGPDLQGSSGGNNETRPETENQSDQGPGIGKHLNASPLNNPRRHPKDRRNPPQGLANHLQGPPATHIPLHPFRDSLRRHLAQPPQGQSSRRLQHPGRSPTPGNSRLRLSQPGKDCNPKALGRAQSHLCRSCLPAQRRRNGSFHDRRQQAQSRRVQGLDFLDAGRKPVLGLLQENGRYRAGGKGRNVWWSATRARSLRVDL